MDFYVQIDVNFNYSYFHAEIHLIYSTYIKTKCKITQAKHPPHWWKQIHSTRFETKAYLPYILVNAPRSFTWCQID